MIEIELRGVEVHGHHGVEEEERREGQTFLFDVWFDVGEQVLSDRIEDTVDYRSVVELIEEISDSRAFQLLEALAAAVADAIVGRFPVGRVRVRVRKPEVGLPVEYSAATVQRP